MGVKETVEEAASDAELLFQGRTNLFETLLAVIGEGVGNCLHNRDQTHFR